MLECCGKDGKFGMAKEVLEEMEKSKFPISWQHYKGFLGNAANSNNIGSCLEMLEYMGSKERRTTADYDSVLPGVDKYGTLAEAKQLQDMIVTDRVTITPDKQVFLLHAYAKNSALGYAWDIFNNIKGKVVFSADTYVALLKCIIKANDVAKVSPLIEKMRLDKVQAEKKFYTDVLSFLMKKGEDKKVYDLLEYWIKKEGHQFDSSLLRELIISRAAKGDINQAKKLYQQMVQEKHPIPPQVISALLSASSIHGQAIEFLHILRGDGVKIPPEAFNAILEQIQVTKDHNQAVHFLEYMSKEPEWMDTNRANKVLQVFVNQKQSEKVQALISTMHTKNLKLDTGIYTTLIEFFVQEDKLDTAIDTLKKMIESDVKVNGDSFRPLVGKLVRTQQKEKALNVLDMVEAVGANVQNLRKHVTTLL